MSTTPIARIGMACVALAMLTGCDGSGSIAPLFDAVSEPLPLDIRMDAPGTGWRTPSASIAPVPGGLTIVRRRDAECGVDAEAVVRRAGNQIDVVAHVQRNWISACAEVPVVLSYEGEVMGFEEGRYRVRLFESFMGSPPRLATSATLTVPRAAP
jgi:hypothetical protein